MRCLGPELKSALAAHAGLKQEEIKSLDLEAAQKLITQLKASLQARELQLERNMEEVASVRGNMEQVMVSQLSALRRPAHLVMIPIMRSAQANGTPEIHCKRAQCTHGDMMSVRRGGRSCTRYCPLFHALRSPAGGSS